MTKKAYIFTLDSTIAAILAMIFIVATSYFTLKAEEPNIAKIQLLKTGNDVVNLLDNLNVLEDLDQNEIQTKLTEILPVKHKILLTSSGQVGCDFTLGDSIPADKFVASNNIFYAANYNNDIIFCKLHYQIWQE